MSEFITFLTGDYKLIQDDDGYLFSADSVLLANLSVIGENDKVIDLGCGSGVIATLVAVKKHAKRVIGLEIDEATADMARRSVHLNKLDDKIQIVCGDVRNVKSIFESGSFDKAICNPPYFNPNDGNNDGGARANSRKEKEGELKDFIGAAAHCLKNGGDLYIVYKLNRLSDLICALRASNLEPKKITFVYPKLSKGVDTVIIAARKGGKCGLVSDSIILMDNDGNYTERVRELYK